MNITDISYYKLALSLLILSIPFLLFYIFKIKLIKSSILSVVRMILQLGLVAFYLETIFNLNSVLINVIWVISMILVSVLTTINRTGLSRKLFFIPLLLSTLLTVTILDTFFLGYILDLSNVFDARYLIPITGMIVGNFLNHNIIGLDTYCGELKDKSVLYYFLLTNTSQKKFALQPFIRKSVERALNPLIASTAVIGLISLPGMMTGQILGGSSPLIAIKYQIIIVVAIFAGCTINLLLSIIFSNQIIFDRFNNIKIDIL